MVAKFKVSIGIGQTDDAHALASLGRRMFAETHSAAFSPEDMELFLANTWSVAQLESKLEDERNLFLVARVDETICGMTKLNAGSPPCFGIDRAGEISRLYLDSNWIGFGVGSTLMESVISAAIFHNHRTLWLTVWENNHRAVAFYERWGFSEAARAVHHMPKSSATAVYMTREV